MARVECYHRAVQLPTPPDERIDAPPPALEWSERIRPSGGTVMFRGPRPRTHFGVLLIVMIGFLGLSFRAVAGPINHPRTTIGVATAIILIAALAWKWRTSSVSAATVDIDGARLRVEPDGLFARPRTVPLAQVDYFAAQTEIETQSVTTWGPPRRVEAYRWYPIFVYIGSGERVTLAAFGDRECALFVAQRLDIVAQRAKALAGMPRRERPIVPKPYR